MVFKFRVGTTEFHEPPYTQEEEEEFYRRYNQGMRSGQSPGPTAGPTVVPTVFMERTRRPPPKPVNPMRSTWEDEVPYRRNLGFSKDPSDE